MKKITFLLGLLCLSLISCEKDDEISAIDLFSNRLIAYYPFNGNALNEASSDYNGVTEGPLLTEDINARQNSAYMFNGVDDVIRVDHDAIFNLSNEFTISALVRPEEIKTQTIVRKGATVNGPGKWPYGISFSGTGDIVFSVTTDNGETLNQARKTGYDINAWYLITGVLENSTLYLYVNGELAATETITGEVTTNLDPLLIGTRLNLPSSTFKGLIDEVRIYNAALSREAVQELYESL